jgi:predicted amidohydrolase YtcJ
MDGQNGKSGKKIALVNGRIHTPLGMREAISIEAGCVAEVGKTSDIALGADIVFDLKERSVFPGFADSHMHFMSWVESQELMDLRPCRSIEELRAVLRAHIEGHPLPDAGWYRGRGWNQTSMPDGRMPNRFDLDDIAPDHPVMLTRICGHVAVLNTAGLNLAGVTRDTRVEGGVIELDEQGEPTGIVGEEAVGYVQNSIPVPEDSDMLRLLEKYGPQAASFGLTQLNTDDMAAFGFDFRRAIGFYTAAEREGKLPFRVRQQFLLPRRELLLDFLSEGWRTGDGTPFFQIGPLKLLCDGSLGGRTAFLQADYADAPGSRGVALYEQEELNGLVTLAHSSGMQVVTHAIGDGALAMCLGAFEAAQAACPCAARHQIVHAQIAGNRQLERMKNLRLGALIQPCFVPSDREMAIARLGGEWAARSYRWKTMLKKGIPIAAGSDAPVESLRPLDGIHAAITRQNQDGEPENGWVPEENLSVAEALSLYTWANAWQGGNERRRGEIAPGRDADLVILEQDPFLTPAADIWKIGIAMTLCGGRATYRAGDFQ